MQGMIEQISKNREGATMVKLVITHSAAVELRLGEADLSQVKYEQTTFEEE